MGSIVHRSVPTNLKWFPNCSHAHALFQDRFKDVQVGSRWFSTLYILSPNFHTPSWTYIRNKVLTAGWTEGISWTFDQDFQDSRSSGGRSIQRWQGHPLQNSQWHYGWLSFFRPTPSWLSPGRYKGTTAGCQGRGWEPSTGSRVSNTSRTRVFSVQRLHGFPQVVQHVLFHVAIWD